MRIAGPIILGLAVIICQSSGAQEKAKEVKLTGNICCPKCELGTADTCGTVVVVKEKDKEIIYTFDAASNKKYHSEICNTPKKGTVTAVVTDAKKRTIMVKKVTFE